MNQGQLPGLPAAVPRRRRGGDSVFDVCPSSGRRTDQRGGLPAICGGCQRVLRVTCHGNLPVHMRTAAPARRRR